MHVNFRSYLTSLPFSKPSDFACWTAIDAAEAVCWNPVCPVNGATNPILMTSSQRTSTMNSDVIAISDRETISRERVQDLKKVANPLNTHNKSVNKTTISCNSEQRTLNVSDNLNMQ